MHDFFACNEGIIALTCVSIYSLLFILLIHLCGCIDSGFVGDAEGTVQEGDGVVGFTKNVGCDCEDEAGLKVPWCDGDVTFGFRACMGLEVVL